MTVTVRIKDHPHLVRKQPGVISNVDDEAFLAYVKSRDAIKSRDDTITGMSSRLAALEDIVSKLITGKTNGDF